MPNGQVKNHSSKTLWVVETDSGSAIAHKLAPGRQSPGATDADGFRAVDGTPIDGHTSWVKLVDLSTADVEDNGAQLTRGCILCTNVGDGQFGNVTYNDADGWGEPISFEARLQSTQAWSYSAAVRHFGRDGCSRNGCPFHQPGCTTQLCCALNLSDALIQAGYTLPTIPGPVNFCPHGRVRGAADMAKIVRGQNGGQVDASGWNSRPSWEGIVYFEGNLGAATGHIDFWDGTQAVHAQYPAASTIWFWRMAR